MHWGFLWLALAGSVGSLGCSSGDPDGAAVAGSEQDPIEQVRQRILKNKWASEEELKQIDAKVRAVVNEAAEFATNDPEPEGAELYTDILRVAS